MITGFFSKSISFHRITRVLVWLTSSVILGFGVYLLFRQRDWFSFWSAVIYVLLLLSIDFIFQHSDLRFHYSNRLPRLTEWIVIFIFSLNGWGALGWYVTSLHYDDGAHLLIPFVVTWMIGLIWLAKSSIRHHQPMIVRAVIPSIFLSLVLGGLWEPFEFYGDQLFGTYMFGQSDQPLDTMYDLIMDVVGIVFGTIALWWSYRPMLRWLKGTKSQIRHPRST